MTIMPPFKNKVFKWPAIREISVKLRYMTDVRINASVSLDTGKPIVGFRYDGGDDDNMTPAEARRVAAALIKAADCCDAKTAAAKAWRSSPVTEELMPRRTLPSRRQLEAAAPPPIEVEASEPTVIERACRALDARRIPKGIAPNSRWAYYSVEIGSWYAISQKRLEDLGLQLAEPGADQGAVVRQWEEVNDNDDLELRGENRRAAGLPSQPGRVAGAGA